MPKAGHQPLALLIVLVVLSVGVLHFSAPSWSEEKLEVEVSPSATALLKFLNTATEKRLSDTPGLNPETVKRLMAHRAKAGGFKNLVEFTDVCAIRHEDFETLLKPYQDEEAQRRLDASRKDIPDAASRSRQGRLQKNEGAATAPEKTGEADQNAGPIGAVKPGYYSKLPGFDDLDKIDPLKKTEFLETVNREMCSCGCKGETVAFCLVNDPSCPIVKARAKKIYEDIMTKAPR